MPEDDRVAGHSSRRAGDIAMHDRPLRILLADDDEINRAIIEHLIQDRPAAVLTMAEDGRRALELAQAQRFDLLIFDLNMPHINGDRLIRHLRASQSLNSGSAMILFTAATDASGTVAGARGVNLADMVLPKPIRAEAFLAAVDRFSLR